MATRETNRRTADDLLALLHVPAEHEFLRWAFESKDPPEQMVALKERLKSWSRDFCKMNSSLWCIPEEVQELLEQELRARHPSEKPAHLDELTTQLYVSMANHLTPASFSRLMSWYVWLRDPFRRTVLETPSYKLLVAADHVARAHPEMALWELRKPIVEYPDLLAKVTGKARQRVLFTRLLSEYPR